MKILVISDGHGNLETLSRLADKEKDAEIVLFGGDFAALGDTESALPYLERLTKAWDRVFAVTGNADEPWFRDTVDEYDCSVEGSLAYYASLIFTGSGGASHFTGDTPNERSDEQLCEDLSLVEESAGDSETPGESWNNLVVLMHNPPKDTTCDRIHSGVHVGSPLLRDFVERRQPLLVVCGHIHEAVSTDTIGTTTIVNPGSLAEGRYAIVEIGGGKGEPYVVSSVRLEQLS